VFALVPRRLFRTGVALALLLAVSGVRPAGYLKFGIEEDGRSIPLQWRATPVRYYVNDRGVPGVASPEFTNALARAFAAWEAVPTASIRYEFAGITNALPFVDDGLSTLGFLATPELDRVLATTSLLFDEATGEVLEADIFFNSAFAWSVGPGGTMGRFDLESIAVHEIGHLSGLGHSGIGETEMVGTGRRVVAAGSVMFPLAFPSGNIAGRALQADDVAGISDLYPAGGFLAEKGSVSGRVTRQGAGVFGAHVVAFSPATGALVGGFTLTPDGRFAIEGLSPGPHILRIEPLDDADLDSFFDPGTEVDVDFRVSFVDRLVVVPHGGNAGGIEIRVVPK
jgi:hypothetical protein